MRIFLLVPISGGAILFALLMGAGVILYPFILLWHAAVFLFYAVGGGILLWFLHIAYMLTIAPLLFLFNIGVFKLLAIAFVCVALLAAFTKRSPA
jgi:hypothetical protein